MSEKSELLAKLMAATSVLGLSLGMGTADAEQPKSGTPQGQAATQGQSDQHKLTTGFLKHNTDQNQGKFTTGVHKNPSDSTQIKWEGVSGQHKHDTPSTQLNPQPEPPKPTTTGAPQNH